MTTQNRTTIDLENERVKYYIVRLAIDIIPKESSHSLRLRKTTPRVASAVAAESAASPSHGASRTPATLCFDSAAR